VKNKTEKEIESAKVFEVKVVLKKGTIKKWIKSLKKMFGIK